jgi:23S rRNA (cytosine1962-C5)-methyltransferase
VDASRKAVSWAQHNQKLSGLEDAPVRWLVDDALKFVQREARRGRQYDGLILDPPKFGRGPKGQVWEFYRLLPDLLGACGGILSPEPQFVALTAYAVKASPHTLAQALAEMLAGRAPGGGMEAGELALRETGGGRLLPMAVFARWKR